MSVTPLKSLRPNAVFSHVVITIFDAALAAISVFLVMRWRYDFENQDVPVMIDAKAALVFFVVTIGVWLSIRQYRSIWRFTSLDDIRKLLAGTVLVTSVASIILFVFFNQNMVVPRSIPFFAGPLFFGLLTLSRIITLLILNGDLRAVFRGKAKEKPPAILVGSAGSLSNYLRDYNRRSTGHDHHIVGLIATDHGLRGRSIRGVPVLGGLDAMASVYDRLKQRYEAGLTLIATDQSPDKIGSYELVKRASDLGAPLVRVGPGGGSGRGQALTRFEAADLIGRQERGLDITPVRNFIKNRRVLITGAGGTIGSELTRQVAALSPAKLVLVDASEYNLYAIDKELKELYTDDKWQTWSVRLGDICHASFIKEVFEQEAPEIVLHAAAFKHVPLSELNPIETLHTNVGGTKIILDLCKQFDAHSFTLISTDKAVAPSNIMGASKRIAEMMTLAEASDLGKNKMLSACAVRFGNVLASTGSVVPLFEEQIARGGPVTVTDPKVNRYFMTTGEAAALVLQAAALNQSQRQEVPSIYVLEMGEPVNIAHLARQLIRLRGHVPDRDIKIVFTGLRPGEKVTETLTGQAEHLENTYVAGVQRFTGKIHDIKSVRAKIDTLLAATEARDRSKIKSALSKLLTDYTPNGGLSD
ncbi:polysaccharide biosynthesis protein [Fretibacter rubidus]|uniref:polysaccharide biosynthesis protein n=1 Tax=Fretibacter rubidus TaxID=570162 RepID=UPI00352B63FF